MKLVSSTLALALAAVACNSPAGSGSKSAGAHEEEAQLPSMTPDEVEARLAKKDGNFFVIDNNPKEMFDKERVPGAKWVAFDEVTARDLPEDKDATLVFYCANEH